MEQNDTDRTPCERDGTPFHQARSHTYISGVAELSWRNLVVQNLRAFFIIRVFTIDWIMCVCKKD